MNQRRFTKSIVLFEIVTCFKIYIIKMKEKKKKKETTRNENPKILLLLIIIIAKIELLTPSLQNVRFYHYTIDPID